MSSSTSKDLNQSLTQNFKTEGNFENAERFRLYDKGIYECFLRKPLLISALCFFLFAFLGQKGLAQLVNQDFTSGTVSNTVTASPISWASNGTGTATFLIANASPVNFEGYNSAGGNYVSVTKATGTINVATPSFSQTAATSSTIYFSFLINIPSVTTGTDYFASLSTTASSGSYFARVFTRSVTTGSSGTYNLGISKASGTGTYKTTATTLNAGTTYLVVVRYTYNNANTTDDATYLWINPTVTSEPATGSAEVSVLSGSDGTVLSSNGVFTLRSNASTQSYSFDGLKVAYATTSAAAWTSLAASRTISNSPTSLSGFTTSSGTPSSEQSFTITGTNLSTTAGNLTVTPPADFEVRDNSVGGAYSSSLSFTPAGATYTKTIDVRITSSAAVGSPSGNVAVTGTNATTQNVAVSGTVASAGTPSLSITAGSLAHGSSCPGVAATPVTYTITNGGTAATDVVVSSNDAQFVVSGLSSTSIGAGGTATFDVTFTPSSAGAKSATISTFYNTSTASGTAALTGTGTTPVTAAVTSSAATSITSSGATLNGNVTTLGVCPASTQKGFVYSVTATNSDPLDGGTGVTTVPVGSISTGAFTQALTGLASTTGYSYKAYVLSGGVFTYGAVQTFTTLGALAISGTLTHGTVCPAVAASPVTYTITNSGGVSAADISVVSSDAQFVVSGLSSTTIAGGGGTATYQVTFTPSGAGAQSATITVSSSTGGIANVSNTVSGTGTTPVTAAVASAAATSVAGTTATLNGNVTTLGVCPASTTKGFVYAVTSVNADPLDGGTGVTTTSVAVGATGAFTGSLTGLSTGTNYTFKAYVFDGSTYTYGTALNFTTTTPITNDDCTGAISLTLSASAISGSVIGATQSQAGCAGTANDDVWYSFTTDAAGTYTISVDGASAFDAVVELFSGSCGSLTSVSCTDVTVDDGIETVTATGLSASTTYYVRVYDFGADVTTTPSFTIAVAAPLPAAPVASAATSISNSGFTANWATVSGATGYRLDVLTSVAVADDFTDGNISANPTWSNTTNYAYQTAATLTNGTATTDGQYIGSNASVGNSASLIASTEVNEWKFSLGSTNFAPSTANHFGVILMSSASVANIAASFNGYYLRVGIDGSTDALELWRSSGTTKTKLGDFPSSPVLGSAAVTAGLNIRITRNGSGVFELFYSTGFLYGTTPTTSAGTLTDNTHTSSSFFGIYTNFGSPGTTRRVYLDNVVIGNESIVSGYNNLSVAGISEAVTGLSATTVYYYRVRAVDAYGTSENSNIITATTYTNSVTTGDFRTKATGSLSSTALWQYNTGNAGYIDANQAPAVTNSVSVENGHTLTIDVDYKVGAGKTFSIATGGAVIIAPAGNLEMDDVTSNIAFNGQPVTVRSTAAGTGSIGKILTPANFTGASNVTIERYISTGAGTKAWRLLASNTSGQTIKAAWQEGQAAMATNNTGFGTMITGQASLFANPNAALVAGFDKRTNGSSILYQEQTTDVLTPLPATTAAISARPAYFLYVRGDRSADFTGTVTTATTAPTLRSTGSIFIGDQTVNVVTTAVTNPTGFTFTRNPFASAIDMSVVMATKSAGVSSTFQVWDPKISGSYGLGGYQTFSASGATFSISPGGGSYGTSGNIVESGAGIILQGSGTVTFGEAAKVTGSTLTQRPSGTLEAAPAFRTSLYANNTGTPVLADGNLLLIDDNNDNNLDLEDARKNTNFGENFGIDKAGTAIAIEKRRMPVAGDTVFFTMSKLKAVNYSLVFEPADLPVANVAAVLEDAYTNTRTPVDLLSTTTYNFSVDANAASAAANRFRLVFREQAPLPVSIVLLKAAQAGSNIAVEWKVSDQSGVIAYEVAKSTDAATFNNVASVAPQAGTGEITYNWLDVAPVAGANFYRVKTIYQNGNFRYSPVARVVLGKAGASVTIAPNPVKGNLINLQLNAQPAGDYTIRLHNATGQLLMVKKAQHNGGSASQTFTLPSTIVNGVYQLEVILPDNTKQVQKLIIDPAN